MKLCIRKETNEIVNDIHTWHPRDIDMTKEAARVWGGKQSDYWCIPILDRNIFSRILSNDEMDIYDFIKSSYLRKYLTISMDFAYEDIDPCWLEELVFKDGTHPLYKLFANRVLKKIKNISSFVNGIVFRARDRQIGEDGKIKILPSEEDCLNYNLASCLTDLETQVMTMHPDYLASHGGKINWLTGNQIEKVFKLASMRDSINTLLCKDQRYLMITKETHGAI